MKTKHTQGPWETGQDSGSDNQAVGPVAGGVAVCQIVTTDGQGLTHRGTLKTAAANAALIAAAPELLAALRNLVKRNLIKDTDDDHYDEVLDAIAKAGGAQ